MNANCQFQNMLISGSELTFPLKKRVKNALREMPFLLAAKRKMFKRGQSGPPESVNRGEPKNKKTNAPPWGDSLDLEAGEWVEIRSPQEIKQTLDQENCFDRTIFMDGMWRYCGGRFQVLKRVRKILNYRHSKMWAVRNTVMLKGLYCEKDPTEFYECDQTCLYYWKEAWLKRATPDHVGGDKAGK